jgi:antitoxin FitA
LAKVSQVPQILVRGVDAATVERLKKRARARGRSLQQEVKAILEQAAQALTGEEASRLSAAWHRRLANRGTSDSALLIREDRDAR